MLNLYNLPSDLQNRFNKINQEYKSFAADLRDYQLSKVPKFLSVPQYYSDIGIQADYQEMKELAEAARYASIHQMKPIKTGSTPLGSMYLFLEEILDQCFEELTPPED